MNIYTLGKLKKKSKVEIFFIHENMSTCDFDRGKEPI